MKKAFDAHCRTYPQDAWTEKKFKREVGSAFSKKNKELTSAGEEATSLDSYLQTRQDLVGTDFAVATLEAYAR
eukprot:313579-Karenia_brevis.AAC.1